MEAIGFTENLVATYNITWRHNQQDHNIDTDRCENKFHLIYAIRAIFIIYWSISFIKCSNYTIQYIMLKLHEVTDFFTYVTSFKFHSVECKTMHLRSSPAAL
jgi:hypothetical protein